MTRPVTTSIPHTLGKEEARRRIADGFATIEQKMSGSFFGIVSFQNHWEGDRLHFAGGGLGQKVSGRLDVLPNSVQIELDLPEMLAALADGLMTRVKKETQLLLEKR
jgi:hypothetical protein